MVDFQINKLDISELTHRLVYLPCRQNASRNAFHILHIHPPKRAQTQTCAQKDVHMHIQTYMKAYAHIVSVSCLEMETGRPQTELCVVIVVKEVSYQGS